MTGYRSARPHWALIVSVVLALGACSSSNDDPMPRSSSSVASSSSSQSSASSVASDVNLSGKITYDFVPLSDSGGLNYTATEERPVRGAIIRMLGAADNELATSTTDNEGDYSFTVPANTQVKLQVLARSQSAGAQHWDIRVQDNTANNGLYTMVGALQSTGSNDSVRNLHAVSGWGGSGYTEDRVAAPFAILDTAYDALQTLREVDPALYLPVSYFRWSKNNTTASGNIADGDIGTSFYGNPDDGELALYILGEVNVDTDEYDRHVIAHEWAHYLEDVLTGRLDSLGGSHSLNDALDKRVAWSEGFSNAFSAIALDDPFYRDSYGPQQGIAFGFAIDSTNHAPAGWFNEGSVQSIMYNFSKQQGFDKIYHTLTHSDFKNADPFISIFTFNHVLSTHFPGSPTTNLTSLLNQQQIYSLNQYGEGETNNGGIENLLPIYRHLIANGVAVNVCSDQTYGTGNTLGVDAFLRFTVPTAGDYILKVEKTSSGGRVTDPDFFLYHRGSLLTIAWEIIDDVEEKTLSLQAAREYIVTVTDWENHPFPGSFGYQPSCFDVTLTPN